MISIRFEIEKFLCEVMRNARAVVKSKCLCLCLWLCAYFVVKAESDVSGCLNDGMNDL